MHMNIYIFTYQSKHYYQKYTFNYLFTVAFQPQQFGKATFYLLFILSNSPNSLLQNDFLAVSPPE